MDIQEIISAFIKDNVSMGQLAGNDELRSKASLSMT